ncbi:hypothetical protein [Nannocystis pusilla]|uniref:hypothetical protein n=1 Tax=Nannocystis pusilla TaxID=889268 RepID=UPI003B7E20EA
MRAVDIASDPPKAPLTVVPIDGLFAVRPDDSAMLGWSSEDKGSNGDLAVFALDGTKVGPSAPIHDAPGRVSDREFQWSADGRSRSTWPMAARWRAPTRCSAPTSAGRRRRRR